MPPNLQVFILGCARSGTSITYYAMREVFGLLGTGESHVIPIFQRMLRDFSAYQRNFADTDARVLAASLPPSEFRRHTIEYIREFYAQKYPQASHDIIVAGSRQIGRLYVARLDREIRIVDIPRRLRVSL